MKPILCVDIGGTKTSISLGSRNGKINASQRMPSQTEEGPDAWRQRVFDLIESFLRQQKMETGDVEAIGISAPGPLSVHRGMLLEPPNMVGWREVPITEPFTEHFGLPVFMNNDANAGVLAEWHFGRYKGAESMIFLTMSTGIGAGIIANHRLIQGVTDMAGEVGYHVLDPNGPASPTGHPGSFEAFCGGKHIADRLQRRLREDKPATCMLDMAGGDLEKVDHKIMTDAAYAGDAFALEAWHDYLEHLAQGIGNLVNILNPAVILLGTIAVKTGEFLMRPLHERLPKYAIGTALAACHIGPASLGTAIGDMAALAVAMDGMQNKANGSESGKDSA